MANPASDKEKENHDAIEDDQQICRKHGIKFESCFPFPMGSEVNAASETSQRTLIARQPSNGVEVWNAVGSPRCSNNHIE